MGEAIQVASEIGIVGGSGNKTLSTVVKNVQDGTIIDVDLNNPSVTPLKLGEWQVVYTAVDYIGCEGQATYNFVVTENSQAVFDSVIPTLPKYIIVDSNNIIPNWSAIDYSATTAANPADMRQPLPDRNSN